MTHTFNVAGFTVSIGAIVAAAAVVQWLTMIAWTALTKERPPKKGMRSADRRVLISSAVLALAWIGIFSAGRGESKTTAAAVVATRTHGSCASITTGMDSSEVKAKLGAADEVRSEEETRGPGAAMWVYRDSRCAVHILDEKVEFVD